MEEAVMIEIKPGVFMDEKQIKELIETAAGARKNAYIPYSHWAVGAGLLTKQGTIYSGCNVENASYTPTNCAERTAFFKAISYGEREFSAIAIMGGYEDADELDYCPPCGVCRQVMTEFCVAKEFYIFLAKSVDEYQVYTLEELMPLGFDSSSLSR